MLCGTYLQSRKLTEPCLLRYVCYNGLTSKIIIGARIVLVNVFVLLIEIETLPKY